MKVTVALLSHNVADRLTEAHYQCIWAAWITNCQLKAVNSIVTSYKLEFRRISWRDHRGNLCFLYLPATAKRAARTVGVNHIPVKQYSKQFLSCSCNRVVNGLNC
jgi:hypothetical protein